MIACGLSALVVRFVELPWIFLVSDVAFYAMQKSALGVFYAINALYVAVGFGLVHRRRWAFLLAFPLLAVSTYFSAFANAWAVEGHDDPVDLPIFLFVFGVWNLGWATLLFLSRGTVQRVA